MTDKPSWYDHAACKGQTNIMFTAQGGRGRQARWRKAQALCAKCPVADVCLASALVEEFGMDAILRAGVRGGQAPSMRRRQGWKRAELQARLDAELLAWPTKMERHGKRLCARDGCNVMFKPHPKAPHTRFCSRRCARSTYERDRRRNDPAYRARHIERRRAAYQRDHDYELARQRRYDRAKKAAMEEVA